jgi:hypothetical protein
MTNDSLNADDIVVDPIESAFLAPTRAAPCSQIYWYGERGIVNAVIAHVTRSGDATSRVKALLSAVWWANGDLPEWFDLIEDVVLIVEIGLADFGDPDLMIVCRTKKGIKLVFLEAKIVSYMDSMQSTLRSSGTKWGISQKGFNSSINGQISLKYRFAKALSRWDGKSHAICEPAELFAAYQSRLTDSNSKSPGRALAKPSILNGIFTPLGLCGLPEENCYYVALTWDLVSKEFHSCPDVPDDCLPVLLNNASVDVFRDAGNRVGWIGYKKLFDALQLGRSAEFTTAFRTMQEQLEPSESYYIESRRGRWNTFPPDIVSLASEIADALDGQAQRYAGSYSIADENNETIAKIIPNHSSVFVGLRVGTPAAIAVKTWDLASAGPVVRNIRNVQFEGVNVIDKTQAQEFISMMRLRTQTLPSEAEPSPNEPEL